MKRIETLEDVKLAMELNEHFKNKLLVQVKDRQDAYSTNCHYQEQQILKECKKHMAEALDEAKTLGSLNLYVSQVQNKIKECLDSKWIPSLEDCINYSLEENDEDDVLSNAIIDNGKIYQLIEDYSRGGDKTFIMRYEFCSDDRLPNWECVGWYAGEPDYDATTQFYGHL